MTEQVYRRCCGLDVHKDTVVVCVLPVVGQKGEIRRKRFRTFTGDLIRMRVWLKQLKVTEIAMESTGVYWRCVWNVLEEHGFRLILVNPAQVKALQGRKSDPRDAKRIAEFLQDERLDPSYVPSREFRELRTLLRNRVHLLEERNQVSNQIRDLFESANLKFSSVASDLMGLSGRRIIEAILAGQDSPERLSWKVKGNLRKKEQEVQQALCGEFSDFLRLMLRLTYQRYEFLSQQVAALEAEVARRMEPYAHHVQNLNTIPGVDRILAWQLIAELGVDMSVFPDADHAASWAGLSPGTCESAGKQLSGRTKKGNKYLRRGLTQGAWAVSRCKEGYLRSFFYRVKARRGWGKAIIAVAHKILITAYMILQTGEPYRDLGGDYFDKLYPERTARRLLERLQRLGLQVQVVHRELGDSRDDRR